MPHKLLNRSEIASDVSQGQLIITGFNADHCRPASYILTLGRRFRRWRAARSSEWIDLWSPNAADDFLENAEEQDEWIIAHREFILTGTAEKISLPVNRWATVSPLSHIARFGLSIHCGADFINPGFGQGVPTEIALELVNHNGHSLRLRAGMPIAHLRIATLAPGGDVTPSVYTGKESVSPPRFFEELSPVFEVGPG